MLAWELQPAAIVEESGFSNDSLIPIDSDFTRNIVNQILNNEDFDLEEASEMQLTSIDLNVEPSEQR